MKKTLFFNLSAFFFFYFSALGVYVIFLPKILLDLGYSSFQIGSIFAAAPLMRFIVPFFFLKYISLNKRVFKISLFICVFASSLFYITINNYYAFMINNAILAATLSLILPYLEVIAIKQLTNKYGKSRLFGSLGFLLIALFLASFIHNSYDAISYYLIANILTVVFALYLLRFDIIKQDKQSDETFDVFKHSSFWISLFFMQVSFGAFYNFFTIYETEHNISLELTSFLWAFGVICEIAMLYFQSPLLKRNLLTILKFSIAITILRWLLLFAYPENIAISFIAQSFHAFSFGLYHTSLLLYLYQLYSNKKLAQQFMYGIGYGLGGFIGAFLAGLLYGEYLFLYSAFFALCSLIALLVFEKNTLKYS